MNKKCVGCGLPVPPKETPGRSAVFCSDACHKLNAKDIRRVNDMLTAAERELFALESPGAIKQYCTLAGRTHAQQIDDAKADIARLRARLLVLLAR